MGRIAKKAWIAFGRIFDFAPERTYAGQKLTEMRMTLARRGELSAIGADVQKVLGDTKKVAARLNG